MIKLSHLISLPVYSIYEVRYEGVIENALIDTKTKKLACLIVYDEETDTKKVVFANKIYSVTNTNLTIKNCSCINLYESVEKQISGYINPINSSLHSIDNGYIGQVNDIILKGNNVTSLQVNNEKVDVCNILAMGPKVSILKQKEKQNLSFFQQNKIKIKKSPQPIVEQKVSILSPSTFSSMPQKAVVNYNFLLNRIVTKDIKTATGEIIVKKDAIITYSTISCVKQYGKIKELTLYSK